MQYDVAYRIRKEKKNYEKNYVCFNTSLIEFCFSLLFQDYILYMNKIHKKYLELFGSSPDNRTVRIDKDKLTIISDNEIVDEFKNWKEMKKWLETTQDACFSIRDFPLDKEV